MCRILDIPRSSYYYKAVETVSESTLEEAIKTIFFDNKEKFVARKIKKGLEKKGIKVSRRCICRIMRRLHLVSLYQEVVFKPHSKGKKRGINC